MPEYEAAWPSRRREPLLLRLLGWQAGLGQAASAGVEAALVGVGRGAGVRGGRPVCEERAAAVREEGTVLGLLE